MSDKTYIEFKIRYYYMEAPKHYSADLLFYVKDVRGAKGELDKEIKAFQLYLSQNPIEDLEIFQKNIGMKARKHTWLKGKTNASKTITLTATSFEGLSNLITAFIDRKRISSTVVTLDGFSAEYADRLAYDEHIPTIMKLGNDRAKLLADASGVDLGQALQIRETEAGYREPSLYRGPRYSDIEHMMCESFRSCDDDEPEEGPSIDMVKSDRKVSIEYRFMYAIRQAA